MGFFKKKVKEFKRGVKDEFKHKMAVRKAEKQSFREAELEEAEKFGKQKATIQRKERVKKLTTARSVKFGGFGGPTQKGSPPSIADHLLGGGKRSKPSSGFEGLSKALGTGGTSRTTKPKTKRKKRKKGGKGKSVTVRFS